ncbi:MAG: hypothetical protein ACMG6S_27410, partial [Byssovorax sp.]
MKASEAVPVIRAKVIDLSTIVLTTAYHRTREDGMNAMEAAAYLAGMEHTEAPYGVCPVIRAVVHSLNYHLSSDRTCTRLLVPLLPKILNTSATRENMTQRGWMAVDWVVRVYMAAWMKRAGLAAHASALRALPPIVDMASLEASTEVMRAARAAWDAARNAALKAARKATRRAVWNDLLNKATRKAVVAGWRAGRGAVGTATAYAHPGLAARELIMWNPISDGEWLVMTRTISPTV